MNTYKRTLPHVRPRRLTAEEDVVGLSREIGVLKETAGLQTLLLDVPAGGLPRLEAAAPTTAVAPSVHGSSEGGQCES